MANPAEVLLHGVDASLKSMETMVSVAVGMETAGADSTLILDYEKSTAEAKAGEPPPQEATRFRASLLGTAALDVQALLDFIKNTNLKFDATQAEQLKNRKAHLLVQCKAFFYDSGAPATAKDTDPHKASVAMLFSVETTDQSDIIGTFIDAQDLKNRLGELFKLKSVSLRIVRCDEEGLKAIKHYAEQMKAPSATVALKAPAAA